MMRNSYIIAVSREGLRLYVGRLGNNGRYTVFEDTECGSYDRFLAIPLSDEDKKEAVVGVIFSQTFSESSRKAFIDGLLARGFGYVQECRFDEYLCHTVKGHGTLMVLSADSDDLCVAVYDVETCRMTSSTVLPGAGKDPMVDVLAEYIWTKIHDKSDWLDHGKCIGEVRRVSRKFLQSGLPEYEGEVFLEGRSHEFFVRRADAEVDNGIDVGSSSLLAALNDYANEHELRRDDTTMALSDGLASNKYFHDVLNGFVSSMMDVDDKVVMALLNKMVNDINHNRVYDGENGIIADGLPLSSIHARPKDTSISFAIDIPKSISSINVYRDNVLIRTITEPEFADSGLSPDREYMYSFEMVHVDRMGYESRSAKTSISIRTVSVRLDDIAILSVADNGDRVTLSWRQPKNGDVRIYVSDRSFGLHGNDRIDLSTFHYDMLPVLDTSYVVEKNFCGERYFIPVTCVGDTAVVGNERCVESMVVPTGVRVDSTDMAHVKVLWIWDGVPAVRISWTSEGGNERWEDIANKGQEPEYELGLPSKTREFTVKVRALYVSGTGKVLMSECFTQTVQLAMVTVCFLKAKSEAVLFMHRDEYTLTLSASGEPPCDLNVITGEGDVPLDLNNFKSLLTIPHAELADGAEHKYRLTYHRMDAKAPLFFRIVPADRHLPLRILPETQKIK